MAIPEFEPRSPQTEQQPEIQTIPEQPMPPEQIQQIGVQAIPQHPASLQDPSTNQVVAQNMNMQPPLSIPDTPENIHTWVKGKDTDSKTWAGFFYERLIQIANLFGRKVVVNKPSNA